MDQTFKFSEALDAVADTYNGFVFWSILTSLGVTIWYFPLWHMGISGYEVFVMSTISPFLLGIGSVHAVLARNLRVVHLLSLTGLLAYAITSPELRLFAVGSAVALQCFAWSVTWHAARFDSGKLEARALAWCAGLILSSVAKFACHSNNPIWPIMNSVNGGWNKTGLALAVLAALRSTRRRPDEWATEERKLAAFPFLPALGLAGMCFGMHSLLSDSSTMILWVWDGFPVRGPIAVHGVVTITAMCGGLLAGVYYREKLTSPMALAMVAAGAFLVTSFHHWLGYLGALSFAVGIMSLAPALVGSAAQSRSATVFGLGFLLYNILVLAHVWVVAYAFVPGGPVMREHTDWVMTATVVLVGAGVLGLPRTSGAGKRAAPSTFKDKPRARGGSRSFYYTWLLVATELLAISVAYLRFPTNDYAPHHAAEKSLTAGIWTVHFALDNDMYSSERRMGALLRELELDVVGLLESDLQRIIMGNRDATQGLAEELGMYVDYGPGPDKHTWGAALLSRFPIVNSTHHLLPSPVGELAPAIHATLDAYGELVDVVVFHSGQEEDPEDRRLQSEYLAGLMKDSPRPLILLSYLVTKPNEGNYHTYVGERSGMRDIDPSDWDRWCEYILYRGLRRTGYARVSRSTITDTELQVRSHVPLSS